MIAKVKQTAYQQCLPDAIQDLLPLKETCDYIVLYFCTSNTDYCSV
ncbi:hypothetical protein ASZ90_017250 [hydrocarbon metagenome]|uniref:Uncharacterized protein n=1 Tax=hydrocarbon metagenome TaxID=938273 RepID=A0A0W8E9S4_9ZZZZ